MPAPSSAPFEKRPVPVRFSVITPCFNAAHYLEETIEGVVGQTAVRSGRVELDYWVIDGGSTDGTEQIARRYASHGVKFLSEPDEGMYDALVKGFRRISGDITCYINAGDYHHPAAFDVVADVMANRSVAWLTGMYIVYNERSHVVLAQQPRRRFSSWIRKGYYGQVLAHIQQESTFWRTELLQTVDYERLKGFRLAGDFYLWHCFAKAHELRIVSSYLGGFKRHAGQLSEQLDRYVAEVGAICGRRITPADRALALGSRLLEKLMPRDLLIAVGYDTAIYWDNDRQCWVV